MSETRISAADPYERRRIAVLDTGMSYVDTGEGDPVVFLYGNPTLSLASLGVRRSPGRESYRSKPGSILTGAQRKFCRAWPKEAS